MRKTGSVVAEVLSVIFVLGLIVAIVVPDRKYEGPESQRKALIGALETMRTALDRYWGEHGAAYPARAELESLRHAQRSVRARSGLAAYIDKIPDNPYTGGNRIGQVTDPVGSSDWAYDPVSGVIKANGCEETRAL